MRFINGGGAGAAPPAPPGPPARPGPAIRGGGGGAGAMAMAGRPVLLLLLAGTPRSARACPGTPGPVSPGPAAPPERGLRFVGGCSGLGSGGRSPVPGPLSGMGAGGVWGDTEGRGRGFGDRAGTQAVGRDTGGLGVPERRVGGVGMGVPIKCPCSAHPHPSVRPCHPSLSLCLSPSCPRCGSTVPCPPGRSGWGPQGGPPARLGPRSWDPPAAPFWTMATPQRFGRRR
ncbi:collagen alpha-1(I) chain-like [Pyrgilauda ruficollis]|uniref:collagen alpha-1(I) chain-like n=1 Tax=Pyrgilauda ruficollis TaxID=221976 RepID=UPI001B85DAE8|nr:collagen alpha-1(I) chain-like [Pyrgilauda ruficollis]